MDISLKFKGGGSFVKLRPVFSTNGENIFVCSRNIITEYNAKTGNLTYEYKGMKNDIVGFSCNMVDGIECLTACSRQGQIIVWKTVFKIQVLKTQIKCKSARTFHLLSFDKNRGLEALISLIDKKTKGVKFTKYNIKNENSYIRILKKKTLLQFKNDTIDYVLDVSSNKYYSVVHNNCIDFGNFEGKKTKSEMAKNNRTFTSVACHPNEEIVLTGDNTGRMVVWHNIFSKPTQAVFHWHTLPVRALAFSSLGSNFYSGADECVLVKWQYDMPNLKQFLPRLAAGICHIAISKDNTYLALATSDNAIRIVDSRLNQIALIQHLVLAKQFDSGIIYDPITRALVLNGNVGCVQFFSPNDMSLLYNIDIVGQNKVTEERDCILENTEVRRIALSKSGKWFATVEDRMINNGSTCDELRLKFWNFNSEKQMFQLNTSIEFPHNKAINSIAFQPLTKENNLKCVTVGDDKKFKIWQLTEVETIHKSTLVWKCRSVGYYRFQKCKSLSFSVDGSLFATAFGPILTTWTPESCELKCSLVHASFKENIQNVQFAQGNLCHLLVAAGKEQIGVWNLLTLCMIWVAKVDPISLIVVDPLSTHMVAICGERLFVFEPSSPTVIYLGKNLIKKSRKIVAATFVPGKYSNDTKLKWYERSNLCCITSESELYCISTREGPFEYAEDTNDLSEEMSIFSKLKPITSTRAVQEGIHKNHLFEKDVEKKSLKDYLEAPLVTLPPIRLQAVSILKSFILQKETVN